MDEEPSSKKAKISLLTNDPDVMGKDYEKGIAVREENEMLKKKTKVNRYSFYTLCAIMLYSIAKVRYTEFSIPPLDESVKMQMSEDAKKKYDTPDYTPREKQAYWKEIDEFWSQKLWLYKNKKLNAIEFDEALQRDFVEYGRLKMIMGKLLDAFNSGITEFYRPIEGILQNSKEMLGNFGEAIARIGIFIITLITCIGTYRLTTYLPPPNSQEKQNNVSSSMIMRTENESGQVNYLSFGEFKDIIETRPIEKSFFDSIIANIFENYEFGELLEIFGDSNEEMISSSSSVTSQNSVDTAKSSIASVESEGFYGMGELNGLKVICESMLKSRIGNMISENLVSCGAATYAGILKISERFIGPCKISNTENIPCESERVVEAAKKTALELIQEYDDSPSSSQGSQMSDLSEGYGGKKTRKNKKSKISRKTKKVRKVKKTKNARRVKKSKKSKKSKK